MIAVCLRQKGAGMTRLDNMSKEELKRQLILVVADLSYAVGYIDALGKPNTYLIEEWGELVNLLYVDDRVTTAASPDPEAGAEGGQNA